MDRPKVRAIILQKMETNSSEKKPFARTISSPIGRTIYHKEPSRPEFEPLARLFEKRFENLGVLKSNDSTTPVLKEIFKKRQKKT